MAASDRNDEEYKNHTVEFLLHLKFVKQEKNEHFFSLMFVPWMA
jgi:hypothetical protein